MMVPLTLAENASLWAIRIAMILMVAVFAAELQGAKSTNRVIATLWLSGALFALAHSLGSLMSFHHGSQIEALESTANQTEELLGFRFGAGLYINYGFVAVWMLDATLRLTVPHQYMLLPRWYSYLVIGFLVFIAINGAIIFKSGLIRGVGVCCLIGLTAIFANRLRSRFR